MGSFWLAIYFFSGLAACARMFFLSTTLYTNFFQKKIASFPLSIKLIENDAALICFITDVEI